jgi:hypothetical protein
MIVRAHRELADYQPVAYHLRAAALAVNLSERTLHYAIKEGRLKARKLGRKIVVLRKDFLTWLSSLPLDQASGVAAQRDGR